MTHSDNLEKAAMGLLADAPQWPQRNDLSRIGRGLFDAMVGDNRLNCPVKHYAIAVATGNHMVALSILNTWIAPANAMMEDTTSLRMSGCAKLANVWRYFADASGNWRAVQ